MLMYIKTDVIYKKSYRNSVILIDISIDIIIF